jgi:hypothetical protein
MYARLRRLTLGLLASGSALFAAAPAQAGLLVQPAPNCGSPSLFQTFLPWADVAHYQLAPDGQFAAGGAGWSLGGGAAVVAGGDRVSLNGQAPSTHALALPAGSSATSPTSCVAISNPALRFFATNAGALTSTLSVSVNWIDGAGVTHTTLIGVVSANGSWHPAPVQPILVNLLPLLPGNLTPVSFTFTPSGLAGAWQIDDIWIDPWGNH